ncbi:hypothetical protein A9P79_27935 (plasmid) [Cupriavidus taiwanensis]|nr:hypothetical protein A9P79_27935 [Cupriavidus taiwanensis]
MTLQRHSDFMNEKALEEDVKGGKHILVKLPFKSRHASFEKITDGFQRAFRCPNIRTIAARQLAVTSEVIVVKAVKYRYDTFIDGPEPNISHELACHAEIPFCSA